MQRQRRCCAPLKSTAFKKVGANRVTPSGLNTKQNVLGSFRVGTTKILPVQKGLKCTSLSINSIFREFRSQHLIRNHEVTVKLAVFCLLPLKHNTSMKSPMCTKVQRKPIHLSNKKHTQRLQATTTPHTWLIHTSGVEHRSEFWVLDPWTPTSC